MGDEENDKPVASTSASGEATKNGPPQGNGQTKASSVASSNEDPSKVPRALRIRGIKPGIGTIKQQDDEKKHLDAYLDTITPFRQEIADRERVTDDLFPSSLLDLQSNVADIIEALRTLKLIFEQVIKINNIDRYRQAMGDLKLAVLNLESEGSTRSRMDLSGLKLSTFTPDDARNVGSLVSLASKLIKDPEVKAWDTVVLELPAFVFSLMVFPELPESVPKQRRTGSMAQFVLGEVTPDTAGKNNGPTQAALIQGRLHQANSSVPSSMARGYHMVPPPPPVPVGRSISGIRTRMELPPGWTNPDVPAPVGPNVGFMDYWKRNCQSNYTKFSGKPNCPITLADLWNRYRDDVHVRPPYQCVVSTKLTILIDHLLEGVAQDRVRTFKSGNERAYTRVWTILWGQWGSNEGDLEGYIDQVRSLKPESESLPDQHMYLQRIDNYCNLLGTCGMPALELHSFMVRQVQAKIRSDVWNTVRFGLHIYDEMINSWYVEDPEGSLTVLTQRIIRVLSDLETRSIDKTVTPTPTFMAVSGSDHARKRTTSEATFQATYRQHEEEEEDDPDIIAMLQTAQPKNRRLQGPDNRAQECTCHYCGTSGHPPERCFIKDEKTRFKILKAKDICVNCGQPGCTAATCPLPMQCTNCTGTNRSKHCDANCFMKAIDLANKRTEKAVQFRKPAVPSTPIRRGTSRFTRGSAGNGRGGRAVAQAAVCPSLEQDNEQVPPAVDELQEVLDADDLAEQLSEAQQGQESVRKPE